MSDDLWTCKDCNRSWDYDVADKKQDPRVKCFRFVCSDCADKYNAQIAGKQAFAPVLEAKAKRSHRVSGTSQKAAQGAALTSVDTCLKILGQLNLDDLTPDEIASSCGIVLNTARARISNMKDVGFVKASGCKRETDAGKEADVITITDAGRSYLAQARRTA